MGGLGVEVAKDVALGGVKSVTIQDTKCTSYEDLSTQVGQFKSPSPFQTVPIMFKLLAEPIPQSLDFPNFPVPLSLASLPTHQIHPQHPNFPPQFFLRNEDLGKNRAEATLPRLVELNEYVSTTCTTEPVSTALVSKYNVVVLTDSSREEQLSIGEFCHGNGIKLICANSNGVFG